MYSSTKNALYMQFDTYRHIIDSCEGNFELQLEGKGLSFVEVLSPCPTGWKMAATKSLDYIDEVLTTVYPLGVKKDATKEEN